MVDLVVPILVGPSARGAALNDEELPPGFVIHRTYYAGILARLAWRLNRELFGEKAFVPYARLLEEFHTKMVDYAERKVTRSIYMVIKSSTEPVSVKYVDGVNVTISEQLSKTMSIDPLPIGDRCLAWESLVNTEERHLVYLLKGFVVEVDGFFVSWDEMLTVARAAEKRLRQQR